MSTAQILCVLTRGMKSSSYPTRTVITRLVEAAKLCGLDISSIEVSPDGTVRVAEARAKSESTNDFDRWEGTL